MIDFNIMWYVIAFVFSITFTWRLATSYGANQALLYLIKIGVIKAEKDGIPFKGITHEWVMQQFEKKKNSEYPWEDWN